MLVVALATVTTAAIASRQLLEIRRAANLLDAEQAYQHALGAEAWAVAVLARDGQEAGVDGLQDPWATPLGPQAVDGGQVGARIEDLQGRFNLNSLVRDGEVSELAVQRFDRLLTVLGVAPGVRDAVIDWIDPDTSPRLPDGAEDDLYLKLEPARRAANRPMAHPSELRLVAGLEPGDYERLEPYVSALPEPTDLNLNTAPLPVLLSLAQDLRESDVKAFVTERQGKPYQSVEEALANRAFAGLPVVARELSVQSRYFRVHAEATYGRGRAELVSLVTRPESEPPAVRLRERGAR
jgi:general secretion pathway protein K